jgi:DNA polymerase-3 subunit gamma/tau
VTALYRTYRSARLGELIGQDHIVRTLGNELRAGSLAHAYLFAGIRGTGKTSTARILARAVNCVAPVDGEPCNACAACLEVLDGSAVDVLEIDAASNRGIDEMRDLREKVRYLPARLRTKVYIIDEAHMLTSEAWNAFLKTLEEPPAHVLFILCTTEPHKVPETVRSRVQRFDFRRVAGAAISRHLLAVAAGEGVAVETAAADLIARASQGSVRDALSLLDQCFATGDRPVSVDTCRRALGLAHPDTIRDLLLGLAGHDAARSLRAAAAAFDAGADPRQLLRECARLSRAAELHAVGFTEGAGLDADEEAFCHDLALQEPGGFWLRALEETGAAELALRQPVDARLQVEACLLRLCRDRGPGMGGEGLAGVEARVAALERRLPVGTAVPATPRPAKAAEPVPAVRPAPANLPPTALKPGRSASPVGQPTTPDRPAPPALVPANLPVSVPAQAAATTPAVPVVTEPLTSLDAWQRAWPALIAVVDRRDRMLSGVLRDCKPVEADAERLVVGAPYKFHLNELCKPGKAPVLDGAVVALAGGARAVTARLFGETKTEPVPGAGDQEDDLTGAVLTTFAGSRVTLSRLRDRAHEKVGGDPAEPPPG